MLRVERIKPNIFCVNGIQFKPGENKVEDSDALKLMETRQFKGAVSNGDMRILEYPESQQPKVAEEVIKPKQQRKSSVSQKTVIKMINDCSSIKELEGMLKSQKNKIVLKAIESRIEFLSVTDENVE